MARKVEKYARFSKRRIIELTKIKIKATNYEQIIDLFGKYLKWNLVLDKLSTEGKRFDIADGKLTCQNIFLQMIYLRQLKSAKSLKLKPEEKLQKVIDLKNEIEKWKGEYKKKLMEKNGIPNC